MLATDESVREVPLINGGFALVSACDYQLVAGRPCKRIVYRNNRREYAIASGKPMHRIIAEAMGYVGIGRTLQVDHRNLNGLDNRRDNLRVATPQQNRANSAKHAAASSGFKGVAWHAATKRWQARIKVSGKAEVAWFLRDPRGSRPRIRPRSICGVR